MELITLSPTSPNRLNYSFGCPRNGAREIGTKSADTLAAATASSSALSIISDLDFHVISQHL